MTRRLTPASAVLLTAMILVPASVGLRAMSGMAAGNTVANSKASQTALTIGPNDVKPNECDGITLTTIVVATGDVDGTSAAELILGTPGDERLRGRDGTDCVVGGGGDDRPDGDADNDVLLGGPGDDDLDGGQNTDACFGDAGSDTFNRCESSVQ